MLWKPLDWVLYDIPNEQVMFCDIDEAVTDEMCQKNIIKMPWGQAERIRRAKNLPMPCPPVKAKCTADSFRQYFIVIDQDWRVLLKGHIDN